MNIYPFYMSPYNFIYYVYCIQNASLEVNAQMCLYIWCVCMIFSSVFVDFDSLLYQLVWCLLLILSTTHNVGSHEIERSLPENRHDLYRHGCTQNRRIDYRQFLFPQLNPDIKTCCINLFTQNLKVNFVEFPKKALII